MKPYPKYKPSNIPWIGEIPDHWGIKKVKYFSYLKGRIGFHGLKSSEFIEEGPYLVTGTDFENGKINWNSCYHITEERYWEDTHIHLRDGDLLITKDGTIGKTAIVENKPSRATLNSGVLLIRPTQSVFKTFFFYYCLNSDLFNRQIDFLKRGTTINHLYQETFANFVFIAPSSEEQLLIAAYLDNKTQKIDKLISNKQKQIELLKEERQAVINNAVTGKLLPLTKGETQRGFKTTGIPWLGDIPEHWEVKKLKYITENVQTGNTPPSTNPEYFFEGDIDWFTPGDFNDSLILKNANRKISELALKDRVVKLYKPSTVLLIGIGATLGKVGIIENEASSNQQINAITFDKDINPYFGLYFLYSISATIVSLSNAATLAILNQSQTKDIPFLTPSLKEQNIIVDFINSEMRRIESVVEKIQKEISLLQEYRKVLISEVVTGKTDIREEIVS